MTSHATVMTIRPDVVLDGAAPLAPDLPAASRDAAYLADDSESYALGGNDATRRWLQVGGGKTELPSTPGTADDFAFELVIPAQ